jgi:predicted metal-dependent phosphoesterase TrpH
MRADLHTHTYHSDGVLAPEKLVDLAQQNDLDYLAITDHDCFTAYDAASRAIAERRLNLKLIPAAEFTAMLDGKEIHIHGYFKKSPSARLLDYAEGVQQERRLRIRGALETLAHVGVKATMEELPAHPENASLTQLHLALLLIEKKYAASVGEARRVYLTDRVLPKFTMRAEDVIETINREGGMAVWAHPDADFFDRSLKALLKMGLGGLEVYNLRRQNTASKRYLKAAKKHGLVTSLGSDWHGHTHEYAFGEKLECDKILEKFLEWVNQ